MDKIGIKPHQLNSWTPPVLPTSKRFDKSELSQTVRPIKTCIKVFSTFTRKVGNENARPI